MRRIPLILLIFTLVLTGCTTKEKEVILKKEPEVKALRNVSLKTISTSRYSESLTLSGNIIPTESVKVSFKIPGIITNVLVNEGDVVKKGQPIATMSQTDYLIGVKAAQSEFEATKMQIESEIPANINQAKAQYDLTQVSYERSKILFEQGAISKAELDAISAKLIIDENIYNQAMEANAIALAKLQMAQASLEAAEMNIQDTTIYSPINGIILQKVAATGEITSAGYPVVAIGQIDQVWAQIGVPSESINAIKTGQKTSVYVYDTDQTLEGVVDEINALADLKTRTFPVRILIDNSEKKLKPGMMSKVDIHLNSLDKVLIPLSSVIQLAKGPAVYVYLEETQTVSKRMITTGEILKNQIEVVLGLEDGEKLVVEGQFVLREGDSVAIEEVKE